MRRALLGRRSLLAAAAIVVLALLLASRINSSGIGSTAVNPATEPPRLPTALAETGFAAVIQNDRSLLLSDSSGTFRAEAQAPEGGYLEDPAWRPDGKTIAFTRYVDLDVGSSDQSPADLRFGSDIWQTDRDGVSKPLAASGENVTRWSPPAWTPDGSAIYFVRNTFYEDNGTKGVHHEIDRFDLATGARSAVVDEGYAPSISPDGKLLAYVNLADNGRADLWLKNLATGERRRVTDGRFSNLSSPRFSPNGRTLAFGAAMLQPTAVAATEPATGPLYPLVAWLAPVASAHELLDTLWLIDLDGSQLRPVGADLFDNPAVRWTAEPNHILLYDEDALYEADIFTRQGHVVFAPGGYRGFDWWARR